MNPIVAGESGDQTFPVLGNSAAQVVGHACVEGSGAARQDVNVVGHRYKQVLRGGYPEQRRRAQDDSVGGGVKQTAHGEKSVRRGRCSGFLVARLYLFGTRSEGIIGPLNQMFTHGDGFLNLVASNSSLRVTEVSATMDEPPAQLDQLVELACRT